MGSFLSRSFNPETDVPELTGKVVLVSGGNSGVGFAVIQQLVRHGAKVYMGARNERRAKAAIERLHAEGLGPGNGQVLWLKLDLSDPREAVKAAQKLMQEEERLDVLVNNAAVLLVPFAKDRDGIQNIVMVNYIGTCVLTRALLPLLKRTAEQPNSDVRIVTVNTVSHNACPSNVRFRNLDNLNKDFEDTFFPQYNRYAFSKTMQLMFIKDLQQRLDEAGIPILCIALDPGEVRTEGVRAYTDSVGPIVGPIYRLIALLTFVTPAQGARSTLFAAGSPIPRAEPNEYRGQYLTSSCKVANPSKLVQNAELRRELWGTTEKFLHDIGLDLPAI
ncbi:NAD-P-binding protein [Lentinus tigrinus ALCF2SS1-7]|uniref:NAD-P-binding protein n=1 Tax=Lentinus tigrinus ALCF2SS1-6 TaxID=1328759 RepID=A0A5C2RTV0_9APHY|nr:NAD-P-binding protein [Lentinus tigrinus ALCF2SS1-6]RPD70377.1 NAD-P-binding protein [Lentinus tigrinus ALCF2SS1-7]